MRTLSGPALTQVQTAMGTKPMILLEIQWVADGQRVKYADKTIPNYPGKVIEIDSIDQIIKVSEGSDSSEVSVRLDDVDGSIKEILDQHDVHKRPCWIYQYFENMSQDDKFLIFRGEISSPVTWDEGARHVSFEVVAKIEDAEVGFSIEEGQFPLLPPDLVGKPWPLCFGSPVNVPALRITSPREGTLAEGFGIRDYTLEPRIALANAICCPSTYITGYEQQYGTPNTPTNPNQGGPTNPNIFDGTGTQSGNAPSVVPIYGQDPDCLNNKCEILEQLQYELTSQTALEFNTIKIINGDKFEQNKAVVLNIGGAYVRGTFSGTTFTITERVHPEIIDLGAYPRDPTAAEISFIKSGGTTRSSALPTFGGRGYKDTAIALKAIEDQGPDSVTSGCSSTGFTDTTDCQSKSLDSLNNFPTADFSWINQGERVTYAYDEEVIYIANILPSTVKCVTAYRTLDIGKRLLLVVPEDYYTIRQTDYGAYQVMEVVFNKALSLQGDGWEDDIYVTMESSVGPNTVDIIEWLIETYTDFSIDATSFNAVRTKLTNYPSDFALLERKNIIQVLEEIAFQARCAIFLRDNTFFIKYLAEEPTPVDTINENHVLQNTLQITHTDTEDLVTKLIATWQDDYAKDSKTLILRNNVSKYGTQDGTFDFYIYNKFELVEKSAIFWLIRKSNTWRKLFLKVPLVKLPLETFDDVSVDIDDFTPGAVRAMIESATYDSSDNSIQMILWSGVRSGELIEYPWFYPATVDDSLLWPPPEEVGFTFGPGSTPGSFVIAPVGHPLSGEVIPVNVPSGEVTPPNAFASTINGCGPRIPSDRLEYCCSSSAYWASLPDVCGRYQPRRLDDANDLMPPALEIEDCPGAVNLGRDPKFNDGTQPKFKAIQKTANKALSTAAKAKDTAIDAGGGQGGGGSNFEEEDSKGNKVNPFKKIPPKPNTPADPDAPNVCETSVCITWFPIRGIRSGPLTVCVPAFPADEAACHTRVECWKFAGCAGSAPDGSDLDKMIKDLQRQTEDPGNPDGNSFCSGGYDNPPCCHGSWTIITPSCAGCNASANPGEQLSYESHTQGGAMAGGGEFSSIWQDGNDGDRGLDESLTDPPLKTDANQYPGMTC